MSLLRQLADAASAGVAVASATVVETSRSVPRHAGAKMLVFRDGSIAGTVGGGEMEARVIDEAVEALTDGRCRLLSYRLIDPRRGDPGVCGGDVQVFVEPHMPEPTVVVVGYGHVGRAVAQLARWLGFRVVASDDRPMSTDEEETSDVGIGSVGASTDRSEAPTAQPHELVIGTVDDLLAECVIDEDVSVVLVTRNVDVDVAALPALLATRACYVGVMGSDRRWATTRARLQALGVESSDIDRVHAPIGIEVGAETPEEIAVSIMAEVIAHHRT